MNDNDPDFREVEPAKIVDEAAVVGLREELVRAVRDVMRPHMEAGRGNDAILEWLNALAVVLGNCFLGCEFDPRVFDFFRMALVAQLTANGMSEDGIAARLKGNDAVPAWLADRIPHCTIDEPEFRRLVAGQTVVVTDYPSRQPVYLLLKDIGFTAMMRAIADGKARNESEEADEAARHDETRDG
jgi:hypothetical protein